MKRINILLKTYFEEFNMLVKTPKHIDRIDRKILIALQKNGKISNVELSQQVGLSPSPCLERVKRLGKLDGALGLGVGRQTTPRSNGTRPPQPKPLWVSSYHSSMQFEQS